MTKEKSPRIGMKISFAQFTKVSQKKIRLTSVVFLNQCLSKVFTSILTTWLQKRAEENNVIDEFEAGLRKRYSTIDNIFFFFWGGGGF